MGGNGEMSDMQVRESEGIGKKKYILDDVTFEMEFGPINISAFSTKWVIISQRRSIFIMNNNNDSAHTRHVVDTLVAMLPMFALYHKIKTPGVSLVVLDTSDGDQGEKAGLAFCGNCSDIYLIPDGHFFRTKGYVETQRAYQENFIPWHAREPIAFWRGSSTGWPLKKDNLRSIQRIMLCEMALSSPHSHFYDVGLSGIVQMTDEQKEQILGLNIVKNFVDSKEWIKYKYLIDIDGNTNSWAGLFQRLLSGSAVLKVASPQGYRQWYYDRLVPWENFVPVEADMSDLDEKILWLREHDEAAERIGAAGKELALSLDYEGEMKKAVEVIDAAFARPPRPSGGAANFHGPDISFPENVRPYRLLTHHEAIVFANLAAGTLSQVPQEAGIANIALFLSPEFGCLMYIAPDGNRHSAVIEPEPDQRAPQPAEQDTTPAPQYFEVVRLPDDPGSVALRRGGLFLCAEPDGRVTLSRDKIGAWEVFRLLELDAPPAPPAHSAAPPLGAGIIEQQMAVNPTRLQMVRTLWQGRDPFAGFPATLYQTDSQGWNSGHRYLGEAVAELKPALVVEIGVWKGGSTMTLASALKALGSDGVVIAVDTWLGSSEHWSQPEWKAHLAIVHGYPQFFYKFMANVMAAGLQSHILPLPLDSLNAARLLMLHGTSIDLIHVDAGHDYRSVIGDLEAWWPLLRPGGILIGDDYNRDGAWPEVRQAFDDFFGRRGIGFVDAEAKCLIRKPL